MQSNKEKQKRKLLVADAGSRHHYLLHLLAKTLSAEEKILQWAEDGFTTVHAARPLFYPCQCDRKKKKTHLYKTYPRSLWLAWAKT